jgi:hypothetical protein
MIGKHKKINFILMLTISFFILLFSTYLQYDDLSGTVLLSGAMSFEEPDDEDSSICQAESKVFVATVFSMVFVVGTYLIGQSRFFSSQITSYSQDKSILRC